MRIYTFWESVFVFHAFHLYFRFLCASLCVFNCLLNGFFKIKCLIFFLPSSRISALLGIQRVLKLLLGECGQHADSGRYNNNRRVAVVCSWLCVQVTSLCFTLILILSQTPYWTLIFFFRFSAPLLSLSNILPFFPFSLPKAEERIQGEASIVSSAALSPFLFLLLYFHSSITLIPVICQRKMIYFMSTIHLCNYHEPFSTVIILWYFIMQPFCYVLQQIRKLRRELESSQDKVSNLTSQLTANVCKICLHNMSTDPQSSPTGVCEVWQKPNKMLWCPDLAEGHFTTLAKASKCCISPFEANDIISCGFSL